MIIFYIILPIEKTETFLIWDVQDVHNFLKGSLTLEPNAYEGP